MGDCAVLVYKPSAFDTVFFRKPGDVFLKNKTANKSEDLLAVDYF